MLGQGVLRACLDDARVTSVLLVGRSPVGVKHPKVEELIKRDFLDFSDVEVQLDGIDACFYCLGVSSSGMSEADYTRVTHDYTVSLAKALVKRSPQATFCFISGAGTDPTEKGSTMWARVKGRAENAVKALPFKQVFLFRPGYIQPMDGIESRTPSYRVLYAMLSWTYPMLRRAFPTAVTSTRHVGAAMINVAANGFPKQALFSNDINDAAGIPAV